MIKKTCLWLVRKEGLSHIPYSRGKFKRKIGPAPQRVRYMEAWKIVRPPGKLDIVFPNGNSKEVGGKMVANRKN